MDAVVSFLCGPAAQKFFWWLPTACQAYVKCLNSRKDDIIDIVESYDDVSQALGVRALLAHHSSNYKENILKLPKHGELMAAIAALGMAQMIVDDRFDIQRNRVVHRMRYCAGCHLLFSGQGGQNMEQHEGGCGMVFPSSQLSPTPSCSPEERRECSGCVDLKDGKGGENQLSHSCLQ